MKDEQVKEWAQQMQEYGTRARLTHSKLNDEEWHQNFAEHLSGERETAVTRVLEHFTRALLNDTDPHTREVIANTIVAFAVEEGNLDFGETKAEDIKSAKEFIALAEKSRDQILNGVDFDDLAQKVTKALQSLKNQPSSSNTG